MAWTRRRCHRETWHVKTSRRFFVLSQQLSRAAQLSVFAQNLFILMACPFSFLLMDFSLLVLYSHTLVIITTMVENQPKKSHSNTFLPNWTHICFFSWFFAKLCSLLLRGSADFCQIMLTFVSIIDWFCQIKLTFVFIFSWLVPNGAHICFDNQQKGTKLGLQLFW